MAEIAVGYQRDGFFSSVDLNLLPYEPRPFSGDSRIMLHAGYPRDYDCLIQRIDVWSGNPSLWTGPIWGISNYIVFSGLVAYGYDIVTAILTPRFHRANEVGG
jgi:hypothetical protein